MNKLGMDIGATSTRIGIVDQDNKILDIKSFTTNVNSFDEEFKQVKNIINELEAKYGKADSIGIASPGPLDFKNGVIMQAPNLIGWRNLPIVDEFKKAYPDKKITLDNDANVAAFGQYLVFNPTPESVFYVTVSSGTGAGFVLDGKIFHGYKGIATEVFNSLPSLDDGKDPTQTGIEFFTSGNNIPRVLAERGVKVKNADEAFALKDTNPIVKQYFKEYRKRMAAFLATAIYFYDPQYIVVGGGVATHHKEFFEDIFDYVYQITSHLDHGTKIVFATNLDEQTLKGAANLGNN